jgi:hypothetical protein
MSSSLAHSFRKLWSVKAHQIKYAVAMLVLLASTPEALGQHAGPGTTITSADFLDWKIVSLGTFANTYDLMAALDDAHIGVGELADEAMHRPAFTIAKSKFEVAVVMLSGAQLGIDKNGVRRSEALARGRRLGLDLCQPELAAQLRLQYLDQPVGEFLDLAMEPVATYGGHRVSFTLGNGGAGFILIGSKATEDAIVTPQSKLLFVRLLRVAQPTVP